MVMTSTGNVRHQEAAFASLAMHSCMLPMARRRFAHLMAVGIIWLWLIILLGGHLAVISRPQARGRARLLGPPVRPVLSAWGAP